jgi:acetylornithine deacetylase/succinyl-diaminopimelate desuccinylase-like protein
MIARRILLVAPVLALLGIRSYPAAQQGPRLNELAKDPAVSRALDLARSTEPETLSDQIRFCGTAAPPFLEGDRGALLRRSFADLGLQNVRVDPEGNVLGDRPGSAARPHLVVAAHLDTVFPAGTDVAVRRRGTELLGPGIGDNCRGLAVLVAIARAMRSAGVQTPGSITFVADVGEEGLGDLRGVRELFGLGKRGGGRGPARRSDIDRFVSIDGPGLFVIGVAVGSHRYRVTFRGPGGHSYAAFGIASPIGALGRAVAKINQLQVPSQPRTTFNVGRIGGGISVNAIPSEAWMEVDLRSSDASALASLDARIQAAIEAAVAEENARWGRAGVVTVTRDLVGDRPAGTAESAMVQTAVEAAKALGLTAPLSEGSTDANLPISLGIPAVTIGGGGSGSNAHTVDESFETAEAWKGTQHALLITVGLARP